MRLIDADALIAELHGTYLYDDNARQVIYRKIETQPTVEERKTGRWIVIPAPDDLHCGLVKCPFCGEELIAEPNEYNFCPNCGADMRGGNDEDQSYGNRSRCKRTEGIEYAGAELCKFVVKMLSEY